jgi:hypothetical protein
LCWKIVNGFLQQYCVLHNSLHTYEQRDSTNTAIQSKDLRKGKTRRKWFKNTFQYRIASIDGIIYMKSKWRYSAFYIKTKSLHTHPRAIQFHTIIITLQWTLIPVGNEVIATQILILRMCSNENHKLHHTLQFEKPCHFKINVYPNHCSPCIPLYRQR